jgi:deoxyribonuclease V
MEPVRPEFVPDPALSHEDMAALQRDLADAAVFDDDAPGVERACFGAEADDADSDTDSEAEPALVAGVDQAFLDDRAVSAIVVTRGGEVVERVHAVTPTEIPYIPGLLAFREGGPILAAFERLAVEPDLALFDGSGRIHYRQAGLATHVGVTLDLPAIGVAKQLLCGDPTDSLDAKLDQGTRIPIASDDEVEAPSGTVIGYAVQTRQFDGADRYVNPVYVSPGHRVRAGTAAEVALRCSHGYKLPEPIRLADKHADAVKADYE